MKQHLWIALIPDLETAPRDIHLETRALQRLAGWAIRFTPAVSIDSSNALLLDVHASLKFFGGLTRLCDLLISDLDAQGCRVKLACAPTALAALWLARAGLEATILTRSELSGRLAALPVDCLYWPESTQKMLREIGVRTLGECIRLPRDGLARRIGPEKLRELDRGFGKRPEVREFYRPPKVFHAKLELPVETADCELLLESLKILLSTLRAFLVTNHGSVQRLWLHLRHYNEPATLLRIGLLQPVTNTDYLLDLARIRLADIRFIAPVTSIALQTDLASISPESGKDLFGPRPDHAAGALELVEQLRTRLGSRAVHGIRAVPEHRPEAAWEAVTLADKDLGGSGAAGEKMARPLWMLTEPLGLKMMAGKPAFPDVLDLEGGPERIETGWWDGGDIRRDYYIARNRHGMRLWIFRDCREPRWYLHGFFG